MTADDLDALLAPEGQRLLGELQAESIDDELRVITRYRVRYDPALVRAALSMAKLRVRARAKFARADEMYLTQPGLEQASTEAMARHHARRFAPYARVADLCSGIGGDLIALAAEREVFAVDLDPVHSRMGMLNAQVYGVGRNVIPAIADVRDASLDGISAVFVDPARRSGDRRMRGGESEPPLEWCFELPRRGVAVGIKAAPGLPADVVPGQWELEFVSERHELKASVLWSPGLATARRRATILPDEQTLIERPGARLPVAQPGSFLFDPDPAVTRAGLVAELGLELGDAGIDVWKIDEQVAFLSGNRAAASPFMRTLAIMESAPWNLSRLRAALRALDVGAVDIRKRGSAVDVDEIHRRLKLTGRRQATVVLTRVLDAPWMFVCSRSPADLE